MAFITTPVPNDLIPYKAGMLAVQEVNADGTRGVPVASAWDYIISMVLSTTREVEPLSNGNGQDKELPKSEKKTLAFTTNTYNPILHATLTGREYVIGEAEVATRQAINITKLGSENSYGYAFTDTVKFPVSDERLIVMNAYNQVFEKAASATALTVGQYHYDADTKTITVSSDYDNTLLFVVYRFMDSKAVQVSSKEVVSLPTFEVTLIDIMQSAATSEKFNRTRVVARMSLTGDIPEAPSQEELNTNMVYNFAETPVPAGIKPFTESFSPYIESEA